MLGNYQVAPQVALSSIELVSSTVSICNCYRKLFEDEMSDCVLESRIYMYSSFKVLELLRVLKTSMSKETMDEVSGSDDELNDDYVSRILGCAKRKKLKTFTIVFVERRFTAKILYLILKVRMLKY
jgi:hypothetical protein